MTTYKKPNQHKSNLKLAALIVVTLSLTSCREEPDKTTPRGKAKYQASIVKHEIHLDYLNCYPLDRREKRICLEKLESQYLRKQFEKEYKTYRKTFQEESEKLGFKYFLNNKGLTCESVPHSPQLVDQKEAIYLVNCSSGEKYRMQFNYDNKQWSIKEDKNDE